MGNHKHTTECNLCGVLSKSSGPITIMMKMIIVALCVAAPVAMPIQDEESLEVSVEQTQEFGIIKKAWNHVFKKDVSEADVSCKMENCGGCETKYRTGRRLLEADDEELFAEQKWGIFSRRRRAPPKIAYSDCTKRDACLVKNAGCKAKIDQLKVAHEALKKELADAKKDVAQDAKETAAARAHQKSEAARFAARVASTKKKLADAQGALGGLHATHMKEAGEAAHANTQAAAAEAIRKLKEKNVANHQQAVNESAKKIG